MFIRLTPVYPSRTTPTEPILQPKELIAIDGIMGIRPTKGAEVGATLIKFRKDADRERSYVSVAESCSAIETALEDAGYLIVDPDSALSNQHPEAEGRSLG